MAKQRKRGAGSIQWRNDHQWVRVSLPDGTRPWYRLCGETCTCHTMSDERAQEKAAALSESERERVKAEIAARAGFHAKRLRVRELGAAWTDGTLYQEYGRKVYGAKVHVDDKGRKASASEDAHRLAWAFKAKISGQAFGDLYVDEVTEEHAQRVLAKPPGEWRPATEMQVYQALHRLFAVAEFPCRIRPRNSNPFTRELRPHVKQGDLTFQWVYPDEFLALLRCKAIPLARRVLYTLAVYTGQRKGSLRALQHGNLDADHETLTSPKQKNGIPLTFAVEPDLVELLRAWREHEGMPAGTKPILGRLGCRWTRLAEHLREDLLTAGVTRQSLQGNADHEEPLRFHDLRSTCVVWGLRDPEKGYGWVIDRTGHLTPGMLQRYDRTARNWKETKIVPFPSLTGAIPELSNSKVVSLDRARSAG